MTNEERKALELALEALNTTESDCGSRAWEREQEAIDAIKEALAQPEQPKVRTGACLLTGFCASEGHKIQKAQPEQEPVAWMHPDGRLWTFGKGFDKSTFTIPLYTTPPPRKPLTDEQKSNLVTNWFAEDWAIKAALGMLEDYEAAHGIKE
jgi:hypothetical protein